MKVVKGIGLYMIYPALMIGIGFTLGVGCMDFFYPGGIQAEQKTESPEETDWAENIRAGLNGDGMTDGIQEEGQTLKADVVPEESRQASFLAEKLNADTEYVLEETDMLRETVVETVLRLPSKYIGMDREQFLAAMEEYEMFPPLSELERGFVGLEVLSFSAEKVVVQMNYQYTQPSSSFYLMVRNNFIVVYLDDMETVYMYTGIELSALPEALQQEVIQVMYIPDEERLYDFLEAYSS